MGSYFLEPDAGNIFKLNNYLSTQPILGQKVILPYTIEVVSRFDELYFSNGNSRRQLSAQHNRMVADARGYN